MLTPERLAGLTGEEAAGGPPWEAPDPRGGTVGVSDPRAQPLPAGGWDAPPPGRRNSGALPRDQAPPGRASGGPPAWPTPPPRRPRRRWRGVLSTLLTLAIAAGVWAYVYERNHGKLAISSVTVDSANQSVGCNGTAHIIGTINTNGRGGPISYEWISDTRTKPKVLTAQDESGSNTVKVSLNWAFHGKGTGTAVAKLSVLSPNAAVGSIEFPYNCPAS